MATLVTLVKGCVFWEIRIRISQSKMDHESLKSTLWVDSSDQIQIRIFEIHNLSVFWGKGFEKSIFDKRFPNMYDFLTEPMLVAPYFEPLVTYHSMFIIYLHS